MPATLPLSASGSVYLTDGGLETTLVFLDGLDLPDFASFPLLGSEDGKAHFDRYFAPYLDTAERIGSGFVIDTVTWRANPDWGARLGCDLRALAEVNRRAVSYAARLGASRPGLETVVNGVVGPRGDGYVVGETMTRRRGRVVPLTPGERLRGRRCADDERRHHDVRRGGDRRRRGGQGGRPAGGGVVHRRDRRATAVGPGPRCGDRGGRPGDRRGCGVLHGELRPPHPLRLGPRDRPRDRRAVGGAGAGDPGELLDDEPRRARRRPRSSTAATCRGWPATTRSCSGRCRTCGWSAGAAAPTTSTSPRSRTPSRREHVSGTSSPRTGVPLGQLVW